MANIKLKTATTLALIISSSLFACVSAQTRTPGVSEGNSFKYLFFFDANMSNLDYLLPSMFDAVMEQAKSIDSMELTITKVQGSIISAQTVMQFKNGTRQTTTGTTDIATGQGDFTMFLIAANLNANDLVYQGNTGERINGTITRTYPAGQRQVNYQSISMEYNVTDEELSTFNIEGPLQQTNTQVIYWDKTTGSLVEMSYQMTTRSQQTNADISIEVKLAQSNVYTIPEFPSVIIALIALTLSTLAIIKLQKPGSKKTRFLIKKSH